MVGAVEESKKEPENKNKKKNGLVTQSYSNGVIKNEIEYKDGLKHGLAKSYYKSGKLKQEITYVNNRKQGVANTYYEHGKLYQSTQYVDDVMNGIRKKYRQNGKLMAEIPYINGKACSGLKEYLLNGEIKKKYPKIDIQEVDRLIKDNKFILRIKMSDGTKRVKFYSGKLTKGGCLDSGLFKMTDTNRGVLEITYDLNPGMFMMDELNFVAEVKTTLGNPYIIQRKYNLAIENKGF